MDTAPLKPQGPTVEQLAAWAEELTHKGPLNFHPEGGMREVSRRWVMAAESIVLQFYREHRPGGSPAEDASPLKSFVEIEEIVKREFLRWRDCALPSDIMIGISIGAIGACSNIIAAMHGFDMQQPALPSAADSGKAGAE
jgi:hypothetical protein